MTDHKPLLDALKKTAEAMAGLFHDAMAAAKGTRGGRDPEALVASIAEIQARLAELAPQVAQLPPPLPEDPSLDPVAEDQRFLFTGLLKFTAGDASDAEITPNGINPLAGKPLLELDLDEAARMAGLNPDDDERRTLHSEKDAQGVAHFGVVSGIDTQNLAESRWAVVVNALDDSALLKALAPLIARRAEQQGISMPPLTFKDGETCGQWVARCVPKDADWLAKPPVLLYLYGRRVNKWVSDYGSFVGPVDPTMGVPYYLLLAGRPGPLHEKDKAFIPLSFQYELDIFWAVGRICFTAADGQHRYEDYKKWAERLVAYENMADAAARLDKAAVFFGTDHDKVTQQSADKLIGALARWGEKHKTFTEKGYASKQIIGKDADRSALERLLQGTKPPAFLFTASHGAGFPLSDEADRQRTIVLDQGGLVTGSWNGEGPVAREAYVTGADLAEKATVEGMVALLFACYGGGCPQYDEFVFDASKKRPQIAPFAFISQLPQHLLLNGALGVISHVERAWTYSFDKGSQGFQDLIARILEGKRLGDATDPFNVIQAHRASALVELLNTIDSGLVVPPSELTTAWMERNDARNYALLGDPAARLPF
jgi:hypothetical protein